MSSPSLQVYKLKPSEEEFEEDAGREIPTGKDELTPLPPPNKQIAVVLSQANSSQVPQSAELLWVSYSIARYSILNY